MSTSNSELPLPRFAMRCALLYAAAGFLWIVSTDWLVEAFLAERAAQFAQTFKGWLFVGISAVVLFCSVWRFERRVRDYELKAKAARAALEGQVREQSEALESTTQTARQTSQDLDAMAQSVARDLRAPLRAITGFADIVRRRYAGATDPEAARYVEHIVAAADQMSSLIEDLGAYTKLSAVTVRRQPLELESIVNNAIESLAGPIRESCATVTIARPLPTVVGEKTLLRQIVFNLIDNAIKFTRPGETPAIEISAEPGHQGIVTLCVRDHGIGIPPEYQAKLFRPFQRLHTQAEYPGAGLGLASVKRAASMMGGSVEVHSAPGQGSTFRVLLPGMLPDKTQTL